MIDSDNKIWSESEFTLVEIPGGTNRCGCLVCREELETWLDENTIGEYVTTPWTVGFEFGTDATMFRLKYV